MNIGIFVMSTPVNPSTRNIEAMKRTFILDAENLSKEGKLKHNYTFVIYEGGVEDKEIVDDPAFTSVHVMTVKYPIVESVYSTYEKTYQVFTDFTDKFDYIVRINISAYINMRLLDRVINSLDIDTVYCNCINTILNPECPYCNDIYPRGDFYIMSNKTMVGALKHGEDLVDCDKKLKDRLYVPHVDDVLFGIALLRYFNGMSMKHRYFDHLKMLIYAFYPDPEISNFNEYAIASRVKTCPPDSSYSGYSWDDNKYRESDGLKMDKLSELFETADTSAVNHINSLLMPAKYARKTIFVKLAPVDINEPTFKDYLAEKWK